MLDIGERECEMEGASLYQDRREEDGSLLGGWWRAARLHARRSSVSVQLLQAVVNAGDLVQRLQQTICNC